MASASATAKKNSTGLSDKASDVILVEIGRAHV